MLHTWAWGRASEGGSERLGQGGEWVLTPQGGEQAFGVRGGTEGGK